METGVSTLVSSSATGVEGNAECWDPSVSADGRYVAFTGSANNLAEDPNLSSDVFLKDMQTGGITRVSVGTGAITFDGGGANPTISADGRYVIFRCGAPQLF